MKTVLLSGGQNTKEQVVQILGHEFPLSGKEIHARLNREFGKEITYQGTYKLLQEMEGEGTLEKSGREYSLNDKWISEVKRFSSGLEDSYSNRQKHSVDELHRQEYGGFKFDSPLELAHFLIEFIQDVRLNPRDKEGVMWIRRAYPLIGLSKADIRGINEACRKIKWYHLIKSDTVLDRVFGENLLKVGAKNIKFGIDSIDMPDIFLNGDYIVEIYWPPGIMEGWVERALKVKKMDELDLKYWFDFMHNKCDTINVAAYRNPEIADHIRAKAMGQFKGAK